jgi:hypothetical protein
MKKRGMTRSGFSAEGSPTHSLSVGGMAPRLLHGFQGFERVPSKASNALPSAAGQPGYFTSKRLDGTRVGFPGFSTNSKERPLLEEATTLLMERRMRLLAALTDGDIRRIWVR